MQTPYLLGCSFSTKASVPKQVVYRTTSDLSVGDPFAGGVGIGFNASRTYNDTRRQLPPINTQKIIGPPQLQ